MAQAVVTGAGVVCALGKTWDGFSQRLIAGETGLRLNTFSLTDMPDFDAVVGMADDFNPEEDLPNCKISSLDRTSHLSIYAAREAMAMAGLEGSAVHEVILGESSMGIETVQHSYLKLFKGNRRIPPLNIPKQMVNAPVAQVSIDLKIQGPSYCVASACSSANQAISLAATHIEAGLADCVLVGGVEANMPYSAVWSWQQMGVMSKGACRPFCSTRDGLSLGEGAAFFVLESPEHAAKRNARVLCQIDGVGNNSDAGSITAPNVVNIAAAINGALTKAGWDVGTVDYINAHGTGTKANDACEAEALSQVFGPALSDVSVSSTKSLHGHSLSAAGAIELACVIAAIQHDVVPPTANITEVDDLHGLDPTPVQPKQRSIKRALSNSFAFGGHNSVLAISAP